MRDSLGVLASRPAGGDEALGGGLPATHRARAQDVPDPLLFAESVRGVEGGDEADEREKEGRRGRLNKRQAGRPVWTARPCFFLLLAIRY